MKTVYVTIKVIDDETNMVYVNTKVCEYSEGDVNQANFSRLDKINQVTYNAQLAFREIVEKIKSEEKYTRRI